MGTPLPVGASSTEVLGGWHGGRHLSALCKAQSSQVLGRPFGQRQQRRWMGTCEGEGLGGGGDHRCQGLWWYPGEYHSPITPSWATRARASPCSPISRRHPYVHTCPRHTHQCKRQRDKEPHGFAHDSKPCAQGPPASRHVCELLLPRAGGDSRCATGEPSDQKVSGKDSHLTKAEIPNGSAPQGLPPGSATPPALGRSEGGEKAPIPVGRGSSSGPDPALSPGRPAQAALRAGRARVRAEPSS